MALLALRAALDERLQPLGGGVTVALEQLDAREPEVGVDLEREDVVLAGEGERLGEQAAPAPGLAAQGVEEAQLLGRNHAGDWRGRRLAEHLARDLLHAVPFAARPEHRSQAFEWRQRRSAVRVQPDSRRDARLEAALRRSGWSRGSR